MRTGVLERLSLFVGVSFIFLSLNIKYSEAQTKGNSTFELGKIKLQKDPIPGEGNLIGVVRVLGRKTKVPLALIEMEGGRSIQADTKGKFKLTMEQGVYTINIACSGYEDLVIEDLEVKEGTDHYINIKLATTNKGKFK
jgi:hypothetical protein